MNTGILARGFALTVAIAEYAERKLRSALGHHRRAVHAATMRLGDLNGPRGGIDKSCIVEVRGPALVPVVVRERDSDLYAAIDRATARLAQALTRRVERRRAIGRALSARGAVAER